MAVRSGAGTGVIVSLVVFILTTFFLLVLSIVFYSKQTKALESQANAQKTLDTYIRSGERSQDTYKQFEDAARSANQSVAGYMNAQLSSTMQFVDGNPNTNLTQLQAGLSRWVNPDDTVRSALQDQARSLGDRDSELEQLKTRLQSRDEEIGQLQAQMTQLRDSHQQQIDQTELQISQYRDSVIQYRQEVDDVKQAMQTQTDRLEQDFERDRMTMQNEIDQRNEERVVLISRIDDLEAKVRQSMIMPPNPSLLVDGRIIGTEANDHVFIDRGRMHHIVLGMTFEVYRDAAPLMGADRLGGNLPRGKASLQVVKVGETTSTCKVVRATPGQPVVPEDVIANAVYDRTYQFKFLVHGKYDVDGDARATEAEAEYLRSLVVEWGGQVVTGDELPGDLDFLVLGVEPPLPPPLRENAEPYEIERWVGMRQAHETYHTLLNQAVDAHIPVLNANRFFILTGYTIR